MIIPMSEWVNEVARQTDYARRIIIHGSVFVFPSSPREREIPKHTVLFFPISLAIISSIALYSNNRNGWYISMNGKRVLFSTSLWINNVHYKYPPRCHKQMDTHAMHTDTQTGHACAGVRRNWLSARDTTILIGYVHLPTTDPCIFMILLLFFYNLTAADEFFVTRSHFIFGMVWSVDVLVGWLHLEMGTKCDRLLKKGELYAHCDQNRLDARCVSFFYKFLLCLSVGRPRHERFYLFDAIIGIRDAWMAYVRYAPVSMCLRMWERCMMNVCAHFFHFCRILHSNLMSTSNFLSCTIYLCVPKLLLNS